MKGAGGLFQVDAGPSGAALSLLRHLIAFDTGPGGLDHLSCADWLSRQLRSLGFEVELAIRPPGQPALIARRPAQGAGGHVVMYGHYDTAPAQDRDAFELKVKEGRLFGLGVADNKGPLACRLAAIAALKFAPQLTWLIQGEEETGSAVARARFPSVMGSLVGTLWLDETGCHDHHDGTLRLISCRMGAAGPRAGDRAQADLESSLRRLASSRGLPVRQEVRTLNKVLVPGGCPFQASLPPGARYLAIGVNDSMAGIHEAGESLPAWTFPVHDAQLEVLFQWAEETSLREAP